MGHTFCMGLMEFHKNWQVGSLMVHDQIVKTYYKKLYKLPNNKLQGLQLLYI